METTAKSQTLPPEIKSPPTRGGQLSHISTRATNMKRDLRRPAPAGIRSHRLARAADGPAVNELRARAVAAQPTPPPVETRRWLREAAGANRVGEAWETLSYTALGLCGLICIVLCFR